MPPKRNNSSGGGPRVGENEEDYKARRQRNNIAVRKSREKARQRQKETSMKVVELKEENFRLEQKVQLLNKELAVLKDLFLSHAAATEPQVSPRKEENPAGNQVMGSKPTIVLAPDLGFAQSPDLNQPTTPVNTEAARRDHEYSIPSDNIKS